MGDYNGIGPEITLKSIIAPEIRSRCHVVLCGSPRVYHHYGKQLPRRIRLTEIEKPSDRVPQGSIGIIDLNGNDHPKIREGIVSAAAGRSSVAAILAATHFCLTGEADAMVTSPISKSSTMQAGLKYPGHTELLRELTGAKRVTMILCSGSFRVALATIHLPLRCVSAALTRRLLSEQLALLHESLHLDFRIRIPRIAVLGLNPHAGEDAMIGDEESLVIEPVIRKMIKTIRGMRGPFSADGFFGSGAYKKFDGTLAMYHDQGLIPLKMAGFETGVNFTAGLPIVRTSPDHGTAFDIAGKNTANAESMIQAILLATTITENRKRVSR